jgi:hypothetical protein
MVTELHAGERAATPGAPRGAAGNRHPRREIGSVARAQDACGPAVIDWHGFHIALRRAALAATQSGAPLSLLMLELAATGEPASCPPPARPIEALSGVVATELDAANALARYGEQRLAVILAGVDLGEAISEAERIGRSIAGGGDPAPTGAVIGVAQFRDDESLGHLIERVTDAVARARSDGRPVAVAEQRLRRRPWRAARATDSTLCPCGLYASPCACGLV